MSERTAYIDKMAAKLKELDAEIRILEAKGESAKADYKQQIQALKAQQEDVRQQLNKIREAGEDAWEELKKGFEKSWQTLGDSVKKSLSRFKI